MNIQQIQNRILAGESLQKIAALLGISRQRLSQICKAKGLDVLALKAERETRLIVLIESLCQEMSIGEIASRLGLSYCQVRERASKAGIKCKKAKRY